MVAIEYSNDVWNEERKYTKYSKEVTFISQDHISKNTSISFPQMQWSDPDYYDNLDESSVFLQW